MPQTPTTAPATCRNVMLTKLSRTSPRSLALQTHLTQQRTWNDDDTLENIYQKLVPLSCHPVRLNKHV